LAKRERFRKESLGVRKEERREAESVFGGKGEKENTSSRTNEGWAGEKLKSGHR